MTLSQSIILGVVQGLGEFLPISSSAHLVIAPWALGFTDPGLTFNVALHFGTLLALLGYFWRDWYQIFTGSYRFVFKRSLEDVGSYRMLAFLFFASLPAAVAGLLLEDYAETIFRSPLLIAFNMVLLGLILWFVDRLIKNGKKLGEISWVDMAFVGVAQALALVPGVSRSGVTITAGLSRGLSRETAARFSFLLALPITFGACLLKADDFIQGNPGFNEAVGIAVSALVGFLSIKYLLKFVTKFSYTVFVVYRLVFAAGVAILVFTR